MPPRTAQSPLSRLTAAAWVCLIILANGCQDRPAPPQPASNDPLRIVSFSPAMTQVLTDLGVADQIVGVGEIDPVAPVHAVSVGHFRQLDYEKLLSLKPTHVVLQETAKEPPAAKFTELARAHGWVVHRSKLEDVPDVYQAVSGVGRAVGREAEARALNERVQSRLRKVGERTESKPRPRVLLVIAGATSAMAAAPGAFLDTLLSIAGGRNAIENSAVLYPELDHEKILSLKPDIVVRITTTHHASPWSAPRGLAARVVELNDAKALLPSSSIAHVTEKLAALLHPDLEPRPSTTTGEGGP